MSDDAIVTLFPEARILPPLPAHNFRVAVEEDMAELADLAADTSPYHEDAAERVGKALTGMLALLRSIVIDWDCRMANLHPDAPHIAEARKLVARAEGRA